MFGIKTTTDLDFARARRDSTFRIELIARLRRQHAWFRRMGFVLMALTIPIAILMFLSWRHLHSENLPLRFTDAMPMFMFFVLLIVGHGNAAECTKCDLMIKSLILTSDDEDENLLGISKRPHLEADRNEG